MRRPFSSNGQALYHAKLVKYCVTNIATIVHGDLASGSASFALAVDTIVIKIRSPNIRYNKYFRLLDVLLTYLSIVISQWMCMCSRVLFACAGGIGNSKCY